MPDVILWAMSLQIDFFSESQPTVNGLVNYERAPKKRLGNPGVDPSNAKVNKSI
jgi:hypothetical protein